MSRLDDLGEENREGNARCSSVVSVCVCVCVCQDGAVRMSSAPRLGGTPSSITVTRQKWMYKWKTWGFRGLIELISVKSILSAFPARIIRLTCQKLKYLHQSLAEPRAKHFHYLICSADCPKDIQFAIMLQRNGNRRWHGNGRASCISTDNKTQQQQLKSQRIQRKRGQRQSKASIS